MNESNFFRVSQALFRKRSLLLPWLRINTGFFLRLKRANTVANNKAEKTASFNIQRFYLHCLRNFFPSYKTPILLNLELDFFIP